MLLFPLSLLNNWPELHSDFLVLSMALFYFSAKFAFMICFQTPWSHSGASHSRPPPAQPFTRQWALRLQEAASWNRRHPAAEADQDFNSAIHSFICSCLHYFLSMWVPSSRTRAYVAYTVTPASFLLCKKGKMTKLLGGSEIRHVKHPVECLAHSSNAL